MMLLAIVVGLCALALILKVTLHIPSGPGLAPAKPLPADFIWGVSASAIQSEGGQLDSNVHRVNAQKAQNAKTPQDPIGTSIDFRHRYREDIALAKAMGVNTYRIGISWTRVEPQRGQFDEAELAFYDDLMRAMKEAGIRPLITLNHFDYPGWVVDQGGWTSPQTVKDFVSYASRMAQRYHRDTHWWITFNETAIFWGSVVGVTSPGWKGAWAIRRHLMEAHRQSYDAIHALDKQAMVTSNIVWMGDTTFSRLTQKLTDWLFLNGVEAKLDYIGVDYYMSDITNAMKGHTNWYPDPPGLYRALKTLADRYPKLPIMIAEIGMATENGQPRKDGVRREDALRDTVYWTQRARADGIKVIGYMVWSMTDNFEWGSYSPRFGLYTVDVMTDPALTRKPTAAVAAYREVSAGGGVNADYQPVLKGRRK